jgi:uncharacterized membrane protein (UPF0127 family)
MFPFNDIIHLNNMSSKSFIYNHLSCFSALSQLDILGENTKFKFVLACMDAVVRKSIVLIPVIVAAVAVGALGIVFVPAEIRDKNTGFPKGTFRINDDIITAEIAQTAAEQQRWLTFRQDVLPLDTAMLIKHDKPDLYEVWMLNIEYNLDLIWFDENGNVVYMKQNVPPCGNLVETVSCTYKTTKPALYVMAATAGFIDAHDIAIGSKMTLISV